MWWLCARHGADGTRARMNRFGRRSTTPHPWGGSRVVKVLTAAAPTESPPYKDGATTIAKGGRVA